VPTACPPRMDDGRSSWAREGTDHPRRWQVLQERVDVAGVDTGRAGPRLPSPRRLSSRCSPAAGLGRGRRLPATSAERGCGSGVRCVSGAVRKVRLHPGIGRHGSEVFDEELVRVRVRRSPFEMGHGLQKLQLLGRQA